MAKVTKKEQEEKLWFAVEVEYKDFENTCCNVTAYVKWCGFDEWEAMDAVERKDYVQDGVEWWLSNCGSYSYFDGKVEWYDDFGYYENCFNFWIVNNKWMYNALDAVNIGAHEMMEKFVDAIEALTNGWLTQKDVEEREAYWNEEEESTKDSNSGSVSDAKVEQVEL